MKSRELLEPTPRVRYEIVFRTVEQNIESGSMNRRRTRLAKNRDTPRVRNEIGGLLKMCW